MWSESSRRWSFRGQIDRAVELVTPGIEQLQAKTAAAGR
jgi:hypothetical protein